MSLTQFSELDQQLKPVVDRLSAGLGQNLVSCLLYGSAVRGDLVQQVSDVNLLLVLEESTPAAHAVIADAIASDLPIEPFVIGRNGVERTIRAFATKFLSIRRNYRVLHGEDFLANLAVDVEVERFLVEQALRNLRLRLVHAFITMRNKPSRLTHYFVQARTNILVQVSEALRLGGHEMPRQHADRLPIISRELATDADVLNDLMRLKHERRTLSRDELSEYHARLFNLINAAVQWIERQWPTP